MDATVEFLWSRRCGDSVAANTWAMGLLESGIESDAILRLCDPHLDPRLQQSFIENVLAQLGRVSLLEDESLFDAYERESIRDYLMGRIDGWTLIERGCDLYYRARGEPRHRFWISVSEDAGQHGGQGICIEFPFDSGDFDTVLRAALETSGRLPMDYGATG